MNPNPIETVPAIKLKIRIAFVRSVIIDKFSLLIMCILKQVYAKRPIPFKLYGLVQRFARFGDRSIAHVAEHFSTYEEALRNEEAASLIRGCEIGGWALDATTLNFLEQEISIHRPNIIVEFGSGISTVLLTSYMLSLHQDSNRVYVVSVEQDAKYAEQTRRKLAIAGIEQNAVVLYAPLIEHDVENQNYWCYNVDKHILAQYLDRPVNMLLIDGPSGGGLNRFGTLTMVFDMLSPEARFYMDDAYRQYETRVGQLWSQHLPVNILGVVLIGKGILVGKRR